MPGKHLTNSLLEFLPALGQALAPLGLGEAGEFAFGRLHPTFRW